MQSQSLTAPVDGWPALTQLLNCSAAYSPLASLYGANIINADSNRLQACVQAVDTETIVSVSRSNSLTFPPTVDHITHTNHIETAIAETIAAQVPILIGTNGNEAASLVPGLTKEVIDPLWAATVGSTTPTFDELYNATVEVWETHTASHIYNQYGFTCRAVILSTRAAEHGYPTWRYFYNATFPEWDSYVGESEFGAFYGAELALGFGTFSRDGDVARAVS